MCILTEGNNQINGKGSATGAAAIALGNSVATAVNNKILTMETGKDALIQDLFTDNTFLKSFIRDLDEFKQLEGNTQLVGEKDVVTKALKSQQSKRSKAMAKPLTAQTFYNAVSGTAGELLLRDQNNMAETVRTARAASRTETIVQEVIVDTTKDALKAIFAGIEITDKSKKADLMNIINMVQELIVDEQVEEVANTESDAE